MLPVTLRAILRTRDLRSVRRRFALGAQSWHCARSADLALRSVRRLGVAFGAQTWRAGDLRSKRRLGVALGAQRFCARCAVLALRSKRRLGIAHEAQTWHCARSADLALRSERSDFALEAQTWRCVRSADLALRAVRMRFLRGKNLTSGRVETVDNSGLWSWR